MKTKITSFSGIFLFFLLLNSCKKDSSENSVLPVTETATIHELRQFFNNKAESLKKSASTSDFYPDFGDIQWSKAVVFPNNEKFLIPVNINARKVSKTFHTQKFLVITKQKVDRKATFYHVITDLSKVNAAVTTSTVIRLLENKKDVQPEITSKAVIIHELDLTSIFSSQKQNAEFHDGRNGEFLNFKVKEIKEYSSKGSDTGVANDLYPLESCTANGGTILEIEWWYQVYSNGVLIYEEYVYSTYECVGGSGGGGGGGNGGSTNACVSALSSFVNSGATVSQLVSTSTQEQPLRKTILYNWRIYKALTWGIISYEKVDFERQSIRLGWVFKSYTPLGDTEVGSCIGGTRTYKIISKIAEDKVIGALITIDFTVTHKAQCPLNFVLPSLTTTHQSTVLIKAGPMQIIHEL